MGAAPQTGWAARSRLARAVGKADAHYVPQGPITCPKGLFEAEILTEPSRTPKLSRNGTVPQSLRGTAYLVPRLVLGHYNGHGPLHWAQTSGLSAWSGAVPKLRLWTYRSIHTLSQHASVVRLPAKLEVNWATEPKMALPPRRFEAFPSMPAVNAAVQLYSCVLTSKTYGKCLGQCNGPVFFDTQIQYD